MVILSLLVVLLLWWFHLIRHNFVLIFKHLAQQQKTWSAWNHFHWLKNTSLGTINAYTFKKVQNILSIKGITPPPPQQKKVISLKKNNPYNLQNNKNIIKISQMTKIRCDKLVRSSWVPSIHPSPHHTRQYVFPFTSSKIFLFAGLCGA